MRLHCHPSTPARFITGVVVAAEREGGRLRLVYSVEGDAKHLLLTERPAGRADELWKHTCFEAFVAGDGPAYREFNFAPSAAWAAYAFDDRRFGMRDAAAAPVIVWDGARLSGEVDVPTIGDWRLNLTAVIEEADGTKSYWALAHPDGPPDFHDPACFVLELPAPR